jgi:L-fuconolactonase
MKIDAHQHFWQFDPVRDTWITEGSMKVIRHDFSPNDLFPILQQNGIKGCVAVQANNSEAETLYLLELAEQNSFIKGVVGSIDFKADNFSERLDYFTQFPKLKGFRHIPDGYPSFLYEYDFKSKLKEMAKRGYTFDLLLNYQHLSLAEAFLKYSDPQRLVIDHIAKPNIKDKRIKQWAKDMKAIAKYRHVRCKLSGLITEADWNKWKESDLTPYMDALFEAFGTNRIMYGSDWPVCLLAGTYEKQLSVVTNYISKLTTYEQKKIMGLNAQRFYNL